MELRKSQRWSMWCLALLGVACWMVLLWGCEPTPSQEETGQEQSASQEASGQERIAVDVAVDASPGDVQTGESTQGESAQGEPIQERDLQESNRSESTPDAALVESAPEPPPEAMPSEPPPEAMLPEAPPEKATTRPFLYLAQTSGEIITYAIQPTTGALTERHKLTQAGAMRFVAFHPQKTHLYAVSGSFVQAFSVATDGKLTYLSQVQSGENGTHLEVSHDGGYIFVASYGGNQVSMLPIGANGRPQTPTFQRGGRNNQTFCQKAHQARIHPNNRFLYVPCLGSDHIAILAFDASKGTLTPLAPQSVKQGAGPRHMDFHPTQPWAYVLNELNSTIDAFRIDPTTGAMTSIQTLSNLPKGVTSPSRSSDIHVSANGQHLYAVNRETQNNIGVYAIDAQGKLKLLQHIATGGNHARSFTLDSLPYLYIANAKSQSLASFNIATDGKLSRLKLLTGFSAQPYFVGVLRLP